MTASLFPNRIPRQHKISFSPGYVEEVHVAHVFFLIAQMPSIDLKNCYKGEVCIETVA